MEPLQTVPSVLFFAISGSQSATPAWLGIELFAAGTAAMVICLAAWGGWRLVRRHRNGKPASTERSPRQSSQQAGETPVLAARPTVDSGPIRLSGPGQELTPEKILFSPDEDLPSRLCPCCERSFPGFFEVCPFDATRLDIDHQSSGEDADRTLARHHCPDCLRRFELSASYCYHDGRALERDTNRSAEQAPRFLICRECGGEGIDEVPPGCDCGDQSVAILDPGERGYVVPAFPFNRCRQCGHLAPVNEVVCPVDGSLLLPELNARLTALPPTGYGPRRRICPDCGARFGDQAAFCSYDSTPLIDLN